MLCDTIIVLTPTSYAFNSDVTDGDLKELVFSVWDQNHHLQDDIIGKVVIPIDEIKDQQVSLPGFA